MEASTVSFYLLSGLAIACSLLVVVRPSPVASAFNLVLAFFAFAGLYALLDAHLLAAMQILVYAGAIMVLFVFVILLLGADLPSLDLGRSTTLFKATVGALGLLLFGVFAWVFQAALPAGLERVYTPEAIEAAGGNTLVLSELLFSEYLLPFELTSVLLLAAIVGSVIIAMRRKAARS